MDYYKLTYILKRFISMVVCLVLPFISIPYTQSIDLAWLQTNSLNLIATSGTMATISLVFLFERITALTPRLGMRFLALISILYFLFASFFGLIYQFSINFHPVPFLIYFNRNHLLDNNSFLYVLFRTERGDLK
jgi:hypothetical protein